MSDWIAGIDLGTTNSAIGVVDAGFPILLADNEGHRLTPSAVFYPNGTGGIPQSPTVGRAALRQRALTPQRCITSVKRLLGRRRGEECDWQPPYPVEFTDGGVRIDPGDRKLSPVDVSADILRHLRRIAGQALETGEDAVRQAVITVPAYFNDAQRQATIHAGELAGLEVRRVINEPTAAALAYGMDRADDGKRVAVFDLGGGTFDLSILELRTGMFEVLATHGNTQLGGDDLDERLARWLWSQTRSATAFEQLPPDHRIRLLEAAEAAKCRLSSTSAERVALPFLHGNRHLDIDLTRDQLERIARPWLENTRRHCAQALADARLDAGDLDAVILVGGSTRMPLVRQFVEELFGQAPDLSQNPDEAVALGAVIQAGIMAGSMPRMVLLDVTPLSLGIETFGGLMNVIIPRNTTIPAKAGELFTNAVADQQSMMVRVLQGEREMARDNWELGQLQIDFRPGPRGSARVGVQFSIDENGVLQVLARDTESGRDEILEIRSAAVDVNDTSVERMVEDSIEHAFDDMRERQWTEARLQAEELLRAVIEARSLAGSDLPVETLREIDDSAAAVKQLLESGVQNAAALKQANRALDEATQELAVVLVEQAIAAQDPAGT